MLKGSSARSFLRKVAKACQRLCTPKVLTVDRATRSLAQTLRNRLSAHTFTTRAASSMRSLIYERHGSAMHRHCSAGSLGTQKSAKRTTFVVVLGEVGVVLEFRDFEDNICLKTAVCVSFCALEAFVAFLTRNVSGFRLSIFV